MDDETMQGAGGEAVDSEITDSFMEGWEETGEGGTSEAGDSPEAHDEETAPASGEGETAAAQTGAEDGRGTPAGGQLSGAGQPGGNAQLNGQGAEHPAEQPTAPQQPTAPKTWTLTREGQPFTIREADVPVLAQKGLEFDRLQSDYDKTRPVMELFQGFASQAGLSVEEYTARLRAQAKQAQGMGAEEARRAVELEDREARLAAAEEQEQQRREFIQQARQRREMQRQRTQADVREFIGVFPEAARDFQSIPQEVWDAVNGGMSLVAAYSRYHNSQEAARAAAVAEEQQRQEAVQRQNAENAARSAGSMRTAGNTHGPKDPFLEGWDEN